MKIFLISDLHVGLHAEDTYGVNVRQNFLDIMSKVEEGKPDYLILTGDLSFQKGNIQTYEWLKDRLDKVKFLTILLPEIMTILVC